MPVAGPGDNKENADQAYEDILQLIREKYHIRYDRLLHKKMYDITSLNVHVIKASPRGAGDNSTKTIVISSLLERAQNKRSNSKDVAKNHLEQCRCILNQELR